MKILTASILFFLFASPVTQAKDYSIENKINKLNEATIKELGISLPALSYLSNSSPYMYVPTFTDEIVYIKELEKAGYVEITKHMGLPDGTQKEQEFYSLKKLYKGKQVEQCLLTLKPNKTI